jgi:hypothetical protein
MQDLLVPVGAGAVLAGVLVLVVVGALGIALLRARAGVERERAAARTASRTVEELRAEVTEIQRRLASPGPDERTPADESGYVITHLGDEAGSPRHAAQEGPRIEPALFADLVLRESVVRAASLAHGIRVALAPETRNRIRYEVRREVRRSRKRRRAEVKLARRAVSLRQREALPDDEDAA